MRIYWAILLALGTLLAVQNGDTSVQVRFLGLISIPMPLGVVCVAAAVSGGVVTLGVSTLVLGLMNRLMPPPEFLDDDLDDPDFDDDDYDDGEDDEDDVIELRYVNRE